MTSRATELRTRPYTPSARYWPLPGTTASRRVNTVTDPYRGDSGTHPHDEADRQDPHVVNALAEPPGRQSEDQNAREQRGERIPALAQVRTRDQLRVHRRG